MNYLTEVLLFEICKIYSQIENDLKKSIDLENKESKQCLLNTNFTLN